MGGMPLPQVGTGQLSRVRPEQAAPSGGTPHIPLTSQQVAGYIGKISQYFQTADHHRYEELPLSEARLNPAAVEAHSPEVTITTLQLHPNVENSPETTPASPIQVAPGINRFSLIAQLGKMVDPELAQLAREAHQEQQVLAGGIG